MLFFTFIHQGLWNAVHKINVREERCFAQFILNFFSFCFIVIVFLTFCFATLFVSSFARLLNQLHSGSPNSSCSSARLFGSACDRLLSPSKVDSSPHLTALVMVLLAIKVLAIHRSTKKLNWSWVVLSSRHRRIFKKILNVQLFVFQDLLDPWRKS